jgi:hypothetical protein
MSRFERKYVCNNGSFDAIDSEHNAYWLGFPAADGYIRGNTLRFRLRLACLGQALSRILASAPAPGWTSRPRKR